MIKTGGIYYINSGASKNYKIWGFHGGWDTVGYKIMQYGVTLPTLRRQISSVFRVELLYSDDCFTSQKLITKVQNHEISIKPFLWNTNRVRWFRYEYYRPIPFRRSIIPPAAQWRASYCITTGYNVHLFVWHKQVFMCVVQSYVLWSEMNEQSRLGYRVWRETAQGIWRAFGPAIFIWE